MIKGHLEMKENGRFSMTDCSLIFRIPNSLKGLTKFLEIKSVATASEASHQRKSSKRFGLLPTNVCVRRSFA